MNLFEPFLSQENEQNAHRVAYLIASYIRKTLTRKERKELDAWVAASERNLQLFEQLTDPEYLKTALPLYRWGIGPFHQN